MCAEGLSDCNQKKAPNKVTFSLRNLAITELEYASVNKIEITSWKARAYGIFTRVGEVSEIERVRFLMQNQRV